jgi:2,3-dihydroxyphenylpropionate 1,2-dioxygenase
VLTRGVDLTISARMTVDHGFAQPLQTLFGGIDRVPVVPIFVNGVATPLCPMNRIRALGTAVGQAAAELDRRVLFVASGGLSHDPPVPVLDGAPPRVADALIEGHPPTPEQRSRGEGRVVQAGRDYAAGSTTMIPINPAWDNQLLDILADGGVDLFDSWTVEAMAADGGGSAHEVRTWVAAFAALAASGDYHMNYRFYEPIPAWIAGFAVATAQLTGR